MHNVHMSQIVRDQIALVRSSALAESHSQQQQMDSVVAFAVQTLGMKRVLARVYVKGNWDVERTLIGIDALRKQHAEHAHIDAAKAYQA